MSTLPLSYVGADGAPIACTLTTGELRSRVNELSALSARALRSREPIDGGGRLTFDADDEVKDAVRRAVAAEASCCSFLTMRLDRVGDALVLEVTGPPGAGPIITSLFA